MIVLKLIMITLVSDDAAILKSRKRTRNNKNHKSYKYKQLVHKGEERVTVSGKIIPKKQFAATERCACKFKCAEKINVDRQFEIFKSFYDLENYSKKNLFLRSLTKREPVKKSSDPIISNKRLYNNIYHLPNENNIHQRVCANFFNKCLQVSNSKVYEVLKSAVTNPNAIDNRGKKSARKANRSDIEFLKLFIRKFPAHKSHYCLSTHTRFLDPSLNIKKLYKIYCSNCDTDRRNKLSEWHFRKIFNTKFNLSFHKPKVDTCKKCDILEIKIKNSLGRSNVKCQEEKIAHLNLVTENREELKQSIRCAVNTSIFTFDLQRTLPLPYLSTSEAYYKRKLWFYNLCIYDELKKQAFNYVWHEGIASRGAQEVGSCLIKHFQENLDHETEKIILYSDSCGGQNRNIKITLLLKHFLENWPHDNLRTIEQRYFVSGHSYNSCDRCFGLIERERKNYGEIYGPNDYIKIINMAKTREPIFRTIQMKTPDFFSCNTLLKLVVNRKKTLSNEKVNWFNIKQITNQKNDPFTIVFKVFGSENTEQISINSHLNRSFDSVPSRLLYKFGRRISKNKFEDIQELLKYIPSNNRTFYNTLKSE